MRTGASVSCTRARARAHTHTCTHTCTQREHMHTHQGSLQGSYGEIETRLAFLGLRQMALAGKHVLVYGLYLFVSLSLSLSFFLCLSVSVPFPSFFTPSHPQPYTRVKVVHACKYTHEMRVKHVNTHTRELERESTCVCVSARARVRACVRNVCVCVCVFRKRAPMVGSLCSSSWRSQGDHH